MYFSLQEEHAAQKQNAQQELSLRERALSAIQSEFASLKRRHEEQTAASDAARRDAALRDGRLRREVEAARAEAEATGQQLAKLQVGWRRGPHCAQPHSAAPIPAYMA